MPDLNTNTLQPSQWLRSYGDYLFSYAVMKVGSNPIAEDLVQETFLSAIRAKDSFKGESTEKTWLVSILKNKIIDHYRKKDVLKNASQYLVETEQEFTGSFFDLADGHWIHHKPMEWGASADTAVDNAEFNDILQNCIRKMPNKLAPIFVAKFMDEEDTDEICKVHNISSSNYWVILHRARVLMRNCLEKNWFMSKKS